MKAITVKPGQKNSIEMRDAPAPQAKQDEIKVRVIRVGLCGTDAEINEGLYGETPPGDDYLILGHENFGVIEGIQGNANGLSKGDYVVSTVRRPCGKCSYCQHGEMDLCSSGDYTERGIKGRHGFMAEYYVESPRYLVKIPEPIGDIGVLLEPMSIVEKGIDHAYLIQRRMTWQPKQALVLGAGPVGLLAAAVLRVRGLRTFVAGREPATDPRAQIAQSLQAEYVCVDGVELSDAVKRLGAPDLVIEATGVSSVAFAAMQVLAPDGVLCLLSVTAGQGMRQVPANTINQDLVLRNNVVFGSVNANPRHFHKGVEDFLAAEKQWPGALRKLITTQLPWQDYSKWFGQKHAGVKTTLEISAN